METFKNHINGRLGYYILGFLFIFTQGLISTLNAQTQKTWQWVKQIGSNSWDISAGVACDSKNNLYIAGSFYDTLNCNSKKVKSSGNQDVFVAIFNENGVLKDITIGGGKGNDLATCICITPEDIISIGGVLTDTASFDKIKAPGTGRRLFVTGMDASGKFIWVSTISISGDALLNMIGSDNQGNIFASGVFEGTLETENQKVTSNGKKDIFLVSLSKAGTIEQLFSFGSDEDDSPGSLSVDASGNVVLAGVFGNYFETGGVKFTGGPKGTLTNAFIAKFGKDFKVQWVNVIPGDDYCHIASLKQDNSGNLYAAGSFSSTLHVAETVLNSRGYTDAFLLKYQADGKLLWGKSFGSWYYDYAAHVNIDNLGGAIITGSLGDNLEIDSLFVELKSADNASLVIQFSPGGKAIWADCISGNGRNFSDGSVLDKQGNLYFTGSFRNVFEKDGDALTSFGDQDVFLAKYYNCLQGRADIFGQHSFCPGVGTELSIRKGFTNVIWNDTISDKYNIMANKPGLYWVKMIDKKGCILADTILVTQNKLPVFSLGNDTTLSVSDSLLLKVEANYSRYMWHDYSSEPEYLAKNIYSEPGTSDYWLTVTDSLSCNYSDTITITYLKGHDLGETGNVELITYPNPATDWFYWSLKTDEACQLVAELIDGNGRKLYHQYFKEYLPGEEKQIYLRKMPSGSYNFRVIDSSSGKIFKTVRVIKN
jgi:hypothetical protein